MTLVACGESSESTTTPITPRNNNSGYNNVSNNSSTGNNGNNGSNNASTGVPPDGKALYLQHCALCHGQDAMGTAIWEADIRGYDPIHDIVANGRGTMEPIAINDNDNAKIQTYLLSLAPANATLDGEALYLRYCGECHGADATGGSQWDGNIQGYEPIKNIVKDGRGTMSAIPVNDADNDKIQAYLLSLSPSISSLSGPEVYDRLCKTCHGETGVGNVRGMQLRYDDLEFSRFWIREGRAATLNYPDAMPAYSAEMVSDQQINEMFAAIDAQPHPSEGGELFVQYCGNCHAADGSGGPSGENVKFFKTFKYQEESRDGRGGSDYGNRRRYMTKWNSNQLSNTEISAMAAARRGI